MYGTVVDNAGRRNAADSFCVVLFEVLAFVLIFSPIFFFTFLFGWSFLVAFLAGWMLVAIMTWPLTCCSDFRVPTVRPHQHYRSFVMIPTQKVWMWNQHSRAWIRGQEIQDIVENDPEMPASSDSNAPHKNTIISEA